MAEFTIEIAGVPVRIRCRHDENRLFLRDYLSGREPLVTLEPSEKDLIRVQADLDRMAAQDGLPAKRYDEAFLEWNAIHALLAEHLVPFGVLLMHGSALCMDGQAYIFTAPSGTGKSTHARLWRETFGSRVWMINDDKPMLKITKEGVTVYGTPWDGKHRLSRNACAPLKAVAWLTRAEENRVVPLQKTDAFPVLMSQCYRSENPAVMAQLVRLENMLLNQVCFYRLACNCGPEAAAAAWSGMNERPETREKGLPNGRNQES